MKKILVVLCLIVSILSSNEDLKEELNEDLKINESLYKEKFLFEINKIYELVKLQNIYRSDEYVCDFGNINISKESFNMNLKIDEKFSVSFTDDSLKYFREHKFDIYKALEEFFTLNINNYCKPNPNLIYDNPKNKATALIKNKNQINVFNNYKINLKIEQGVKDEK